MVYFWVLVGWPWLVAKYSHSPLLILPNTTAGWGREQEEQKGEKSWVKEINKWRKKIKWCKGNHHLPQADWCPDSLWATATLEDKTQPSTLRFYRWAWRYVAQNRPLVNSYQLSPPNLLPTPNLLAEGTTKWETQKALMLWKHWLAIAKTLCYQQS